MYVHIISYIERKTPPPNMGQGGVEGGRDGGWEGWLSYHRTRSRLGVMIKLLTVLVLSWWQSLLPPFFRSGALPFVVLYIYVCIYVEKERVCLSPFTIKR